ncbi:MAG: AEC family transporter [Alkalispirochaetaceae bacterium]
MTGSSPGTIFLSALLIIALGYAVRKSGLLTREQGAVPAKLVLNVTLPALVVETVPQITFTRSLLFLPLIALLHALVAFTLVQLLFRRRTPAERGVITICSMGFNNGLFAFPIVQEIWGVEAIRLLALFDVGNGLVILGANYVIADYFSRGGELRLGATLKVVGRTLVTSVPLIAFVFALILNLTGARLPVPVERTVAILASANGALALLVLGIFQSLSLRRSELPTILKVLSLRYLLGILFVLGSVYFLGETVMLRRVLSIVFILPIGMTVIPFSVTFGLDTRLATTMVNVTIIVSFALMWAAVIIVG